MRHEYDYYFGHIKPFFIRAHGSSVALCFYVIIPQYSSCAGMKYVPSYDQRRKERDRVQQTNVRDVPPAFYAPCAP
jgi:hypothetical protein